MRMLREGAGHRPRILPYALVNAAHDAGEDWGNPAEAERLYRHALAADPRNGDAANGLGLLLAKAGRNDEARRLFEQAIAAATRRCFGHQQPGRALSNIGQANDAIAAFQYGIQVAPDDGYTVPEPGASVGAARASARKRAN